ncbi:MAG: DUF4276 family protein [Planctomycetota bacterium]
MIVSEGRHEAGGALETLVRRLASHRSLGTCDHDRVANPRIHTHRGRGQGFFKRAVRWLLTAQERGYEALVLVVDEDGRRERRQEISDAQDSTTDAIRRALGVAIRTFDAWMLADEQALSRALDRVVDTQPAPEAIGDPKQVCANLLSSSTVECTLTEMYAAIASHADLGRIATRCPDGFAPFAARVRVL